MLNIKVLPANGGDCLLVSFGEDDNVKNILIDGGVGRIYKKVLRDEIKKIREAKQFIDLLVITHSHIDHINGIIKFIEDDENNDCIKQVWFNSKVHFNKEKVKMLTQCVDLNVSVGAILTLEDKLLTMKFMEQNIWNDKLIKQGHVEKVGDATLTVLSPDDDILEKFKNWIDKEEEKFYTAPVLEDYETRLSEFNLEPIEKDKHMENGTSIAFMFEYGCKKILFLADSFPSIVVNGLKETGFIKDNKKVNVDYVKLSHHGSRRNINDEFLKSVNCHNYIVSTNGLNARPSKETFARIFKEFDSMNLYFNYRNEQMERIFLEDELTEKIELIYLEENNYNIEVEPC